MTVGDIFSAVTEDRPYRKGMEPERVIRILRKDADAGLISGSVVELLIANYDEIDEKRATESRAGSKKYQERLTAATEQLTAVKEVIWGYACSHAVQYTSVGR